MLFLQKALRNCSEADFRDLKKKLKNQKFQLEKIHFSIFFAEKINQEKQTLKTFTMNLLRFYRFSYIIYA